MRAHTEKLAQYRKHEDPRLSFTTPEFKEASRIFSDNFKARTLARCALFPGHVTDKTGACAALR